MSHVANPYRAQDEDVSVEAHSVLIHREWGEVLIKSQVFFPVPFLSY